MKKLKQLKGYSICELTDKEMKSRNETSKYALVTKEEMEYTSSMRDLEWTADTVAELEQWVLG